MSSDLTKIVKPSSKTINTLYGLVAHKIINLTTIGIYFYIYINQNKPLPYSAITSHVGISNVHAQKHIKALEELGLILKVQGRKGKSNIYIIGNVTPSLAKAGRLLLEKPCTMRSKDLKPSHSRYITKLDLGNKSVMKTLSRILDIMYTSSNYSSYLESRKKQYENDPDWIETREILIQYFTPREVDSKALSKSYFSRLLLLRENAEIDFTEYVKWYYNDKYTNKGFAWGLFLYDGMIEEYSKASEGIKKVKRYLNTSSDEQKAKHAIRAKADKQRLREMIK